MIKTERIARILAIMHIFQNIFFYYKNATTTTTNNNESIIIIPYIS